MEQFIFSNIARKWLIGSIPSHGLLQNDLLSLELVPEIVNASREEEREVFRSLSSSPHLLLEDVLALRDAPWDMHRVQENKAINPEAIISSGLPLIPGALSRNRSILLDTVLRRSRSVPWSPLLLASNPSLSIQDVVFASSLMTWHRDHVKQGVLLRNDILRFEPYLCIPTCYERITEEMISQGWEARSPSIGGVIQKVRVFEPFSFPSSTLSRYAPVSFDFVRDTKRKIEWDVSNMLLNPVIGVSKGMARYRSEYPEIASNCRAITYSLLPEDLDGWDIEALARSMDLSGMNLSQIRKVFPPDTFSDLLGNDSFPLHLVEYLIGDDPSPLRDGPFPSNTFRRYRRRMAISRAISSRGKDGSLSRDPSPLLQFDLDH